MSHFSVLVIGPNIEEQLAPYQENNMGDCPEEYLKFEDVEEEYLKSFNEEGCEMVRLPEGGHAYKWDERFRVPGTIGQGSGTHKVPDDDVTEKVLHKDRYSSFEEFMSDWVGYSERDAKAGRYGRWKNPNKKWDWYVIGGRYSNRLIKRDGNKCDQALKGEIDTEKMLEAHRADAKEAFKEAQKYDAGMRSLIYGISPEDTEDSYINKAKALSAFAVLKDGKWYERGEMGWFACVSNEKSDDQWDEEFNKLIDGLPGDTLLTVVDCHI